MEKIYVALIVKGLKTFDQVPTVIQPKVKETLIALELGELTEK